MKSNEYADISKVISDNRPDYASLFGSQDACDCQHCLSVFSPAAYLVDLLQFLGLGLAQDDPKAKTLITPLDILIGNKNKIGKDKKPIIGRRPDIAHILLSCENTNTTLPYVDLVNEILESYIVFSQSLPQQIDKAGNLKPDPNDSSPGITAAELGANPENTREAAYDALESAVYPFTLPFNQPITALRLTLEKLGSSRLEIMNALCPDANNVSESAETARCALDVEALGITEREFSILTGENFAGKEPIWPGLNWGVSNFFGFDSPSKPVKQPWVNGALPSGALQKSDGDTWAFVTTFSPTPASGVATHASQVTTGLHQHFFNQVKDGSKLTPDPEDFLYVEVFLDPINPPKQIMLQWHDGKSWSHRAYWGHSEINWGVEGTASRRYMGSLPPTGQWVLLEVPVAYVGLAEKNVEISGMAFTLFDGGAIWGEAGKRSLSWIEQLMHVPQFLARTGITYVELVDLIRMRSINPALPQGEALTVFQRIPFNYSILNKLVSSNFTDIDAPTTKALEKAGMTLDELKTWAKTDNFKNNSKLLVLDAPDSACDLTITWLQHLDETLLDEAELTRLHRFIRLWRKLGWSIQELDQALIALQAVNIDRNLLRQLGQIVQLQTFLKLPLPNLLSFWSVIPTSGEKSLYNKLFLNKAVREIDAVFSPVKGEYLNESGLKIKDHIPALLAGFHTRAVDLALIRQHTGLADNDAPLTLQTVTTLYRYVTLARALGMPVKELIDLEALSDISPFSIPDRNDNFKFKNIKPEQTLSFVRLAERVKQSGFSLAALDYLFNKLADVPAPLAPNEEQIQQVSTNLTEGLIRIAAENDVIADPMGEITRSKLGLFFEPHVIEQILGIFRIFTASLPKLPELPKGLALSSLSNKVTFDATHQLLKAFGWLTDAERTALLSASNDPEYSKAVQSLYDQSRAFYKEKLQKTLQETLMKQFGWRTVEEDLKASVLEAGSLEIEGEQENALLAAKYKSFLIAALPYFRRALSRAFIKQTLIDALGFEPATAAVLLEGRDDLQLLMAKEKESPAIADFLALAGDGLTATYFDKDDSTSPAGKEVIDPRVDFHWIKKNGFSVQWKGQLLVDKKQRYQFHLRVNGSVKFKLGGEELLDQKQTATASEYTCSKELEAGKFYDLELQYAHQVPPSGSDSEALIELRWSNPGNPVEIVPQYRLYSSNAMHAAARNTYVRLHKTALLVNGFKFSTREIIYLARPRNGGSAAHPNALDLNELPVDTQSSRASDLFAAWLKWFDFASLRIFTRNNPDSVLDILTTNTEASTWEILARTTGWDEHTLKTLTGGGNVYDAAVLLRLFNTMKLVSNLGAPISEVIGWADSFRDTSRVIEDGELSADTKLTSVKAKFDSADLNRVVEGSGIPAGTIIVAIVSATEVTLSHKTSVLATGVRIHIYGGNQPARSAAQQAKRALKARYDNETWLEVIRPVTDRLREAQRTALVDYLLPRTGVADVSDLSNYFLLDLEMSPCMNTSRIQQAILSIHVYVQRYLMNEEKDITRGSFNRVCWEWMKNYRVWEANRKIYLYPENWIDPDLRDDKTPFFRELESELLQSDSSDDTVKTALSVETALSNYLEKLETVSNLKICGMFEQKDDFTVTEKRQSILHVFGRTFVAPRIFYYRQLITVNNNYHYWTPWEKVPLDIDADEVLPVIWNRRLYLFWPIFEERVEKTSDPSEPQKKELWAKIAWAEYRNKKWSSKHVTSREHAVQIWDSMLNEQDYNHIYYRPRMSADIRGDHLTIKFKTLSVRAKNSKRNALQSGPIFDKNGNIIDITENANISAEYTLQGGMAFRNYRGLVKSTGISYTDSYHSGYVPMISTALEFVHVDQEDHRIPVFARIPNAGELDLFSQELKPYTLNEFFFLQEGPRTYLVQPSSMEQSDLERRLTTDSLLLPGYNLVDVVKDIEKDLGASMLQFTKNTNPWLAGQAGIAAMDAQIQMLSTPAGNKIDIKDLSIGSQIFNQGIIKAGAIGLFRYHAEFRFETFFHPYAAEFQRRLQRYGVSALLSIDSQLPDRLPKVTSFADAYAPNGVTVKKNYWPVHDVDFSFTGAYSQYNWELFFHVPFYMANYLYQHNRHQDALNCLSTIFTLTPAEPDPKPEHYWNVLPFRKTQSLRLDDMLKALHNGDADMVAQWEDLQMHPFQPYRVARLRLNAFKQAVVMKYIDILVGWADQLFQRDTMESITEATQLYVSAAKLLGKKPQKLPARSRQHPKTFAQLREAKLDRFSQAMAQFENDLPYSSRATTGEAADELTGLLGIGRTSYFCIPQNEKLLDYWDIVADRLFKIRHCMNIEGIVRELPLFEPPIDPALLVKAAAQGIDLNSVLNDMSMPLPFYRFNTLLGKALELTGQLQSLGAALLAALEKRDTEHLANLRVTHETDLLSLVKQMKKLQLAEAQNAEAALRKNLEVVKVRFDFYNNALEKMQRIPEEANQINELKAAHEIEASGQLEELNAEALINQSPDISIGNIGAGVAAGPTLSASVGRGNLIAQLQVFSRARNLRTSSHTFKANRSSILGGWQRRTYDWQREKDSAQKECEHIEKLITGAEIRVDIAQQDLENTTRQIEQSLQIQEYLRNKFTNEELYNWMSGQISGIFFRCYQMAYEYAKQCERCFRFELGLSSSNFIQFGIWDSQRKGLLAGEQLYLQLKQLERAYLNGNRREYELIKNYSLMINDPVALISLKEQGYCEFMLPETLFDMDYPGHYMRRIKSVSLTIPAVVGPYTSVNCTLTLLHDKTRIKSTLGNGYPEREGEDDDRFMTNWVRMQAIATSTGQNDSGLFELNFRDERYLPFEGAGAISHWRLEMPMEFRQFDYDTISDVVANIRYTARDGGAILRTKAVDHLKEQLKEEAARPQARLFSLRHEFPSDWQLLLSAATSNGDHSMVFSLTKQRFPFMFQTAKITIDKIELFSINKEQNDNSASAPPLNLVLTDPEGNGHELKESFMLGSLAHMHTDTNISIEVKNSSTANNKAADWTITVKKEDKEKLNDLDDLDDILILCHYFVDLNTDKRLTA